ncbi:helix-turn-helix domain-containing protein [Paenibacillus mucilaginosus]|nr:helix-turn-helix domain-containing protein [Paenibacillus caseinilyticus]
MLLHLGVPLRTVALDGTLRALPYAAVAGPQTQPLDLLPGHARDQPAPVGIIGIRFRPGAFRYFCRRPAAEFTDAALPLDEIWKGSSMDWVHRLLEVQEWPQRTFLLDAALLGRLEPQVRTRTELDHALFLLQTTEADSPVTIPEVCRSIGLSSRRLERMFLERVGLPPKRFARLARFQKTLRQLLEPGGSSTARLPLEHGYYDQSHFLKEMRVLAGAPLAYFRGQPEFLSFFYNTEGGGPPYATIHPEYTRKGDGIDEAVEVQRLDAAGDRGHS